MKATQIKRDIEGSDDFAAMLEESFSKVSSYQPGDIVRGTVASIRGDSALVDISGKSEAYLSAAEIMEAGRELVKKGDTLDFYVVGSSASGIQLTWRIGKGYLSDAILKLARENALAIRGTVKEAVNGGYAVTIGQFRGFCPFSQIDERKGEESDYIGKSFDFLITEFRQSNLVLSRRSLLQNESDKAFKKISADLVPGSFFEGKVSRTAAFGVFVDIGAIEILVPKSELGFSRLLSPEAFEKGQSVKVKILSADIESKKISGSIKQALPDPWNKISSFEEGAKYKGTVTNIIKSGAFVQLADGIEGFVHISQMSPVRKINRPEDAVSLGDNVSVTVEKIDAKEKRISLKLETGELDPWKDSAVKEGLIEECVVEAVNAGGLAVRLDNGMQGFVPRGQLVRKGDFSKEYKCGERIKIFLLEKDAEKKRVLGSEKEIAVMEERKSMESYMSSNETTSTNSLGALLGDKLKGFK